MLFLIGMQDVMLTLIGPDATGIVARMAVIVESHEGNWLDSRMIRMGGYFSGILRIALKEDQLPGFEEEVAAFMQETGYRYALQPAEFEPQSTDGQIAYLQLSGQDHPGIVRAIFEAFQASGVNVEELSTGLQAAPWSGTPVFEAKARLFVPAGVALDALQDRLEALAADLLVELEFREA